MTQDRIRTSEIKNGKVIVTWTDDVEFIYSLELKLESVGMYDVKRQAASKTSAESTLRGCGVTA